MASWLDALLDRGNEAKRGSEPREVSIAHPPRKPKPEIKLSWFQVQAPRDGDAGMIELCHYWVTAGELHMCDEDGKPTGQRYQLGPNDEARVIAARLGRDAWKSRNSDFNRPLGYARSGYA